MKVLSWTRDARWKHCIPGNEQNQQWRKRDGEQKQKWGFVDSEKELGMEIDMN
jgi:hypothetical protein